MVRNTTKSFVEIQLTMLEKYSERKSYPDLFNTDGEEEELGILVVGYAADALPYLLAWLIRLQLFKYQ